MKAEKPTKNSGLLLLLKGPQRLPKLKKCSETLKITYVTWEWKGEHPRSSQNYPYFRRSVYKKSRLQNDFAKVAKQFV
jgi:hypothetical protein